jgi:hypothetical protein
MENGVFQDPAVAGELAQHFVEARLHLDGIGQPYEDQLAMHEQMNETTSRPFFVVLNPKTGNLIGKFGRALIPGEDFGVFIDFLRQTEAAVH